MAAISRVGDMWVGVCFAHKRPIPTAGLIITGEPNLFVDNRAAASLGSVCVSFCGHVGIVLAQSVVGSINGKRIARIGDPVVGPFIGNIIHGSTVGDCR